MYIKLKDIKLLNYKTNILYELDVFTVFNLLINQGFNVGIDKNTRHDILGTPEDLEKVNER